MSLFSAPRSSELHLNSGKNITVRGWLHTLRLVGSKLGFLILRDADGLMQVVIEDLDQIDKLRNMQTGTIVSATGIVGEVPRGKFSHEIKNAQIEILNPVEHVAAMDISKDEIHADFSTIHENKIVYLRHPRQVSIFKIAHTIESIIRDFFEKNRFIQINTPKIIGFPTEGGAEVFEFDYFDNKAYLAQSPQFYKQIMCASFERVYEIGRAYRAEKSHTSRHTTEILMIDCEMAFIDSFQDVLDVADNLLHYLIEQLWEKHGDLLNSLGAEKAILSDKIPNLTMPEVHQIVFDRTGKDYRGELDLAPEEEVIICEWAKENHGTEAIFVSGFPWSDAKFYHKQSSENPEFADRADLLFRGLEMATITRRETNYNTLIEQIKSKGFDPENPGLKHYLDAFKYGMPEQGGFGMGLSRLVYKILGLQNIKEAELFPRDCTRLAP